MHIACKCLNVSIKSRGSELQKMNIDDIELTAHERADAFFRENIATIPELEGITKEQPGLVELRNVGSWVIHRCYNCLVYTHAIHREYGAGLVLINTNMVTSSDEIDKLRSNPDYSPVFRIVITNSSLDDVDYLQPTKFSVSQLPNSMQVALAGLQQQLEEAVQRQAKKVEEKIRAFTKEQYQLLEQFRERAHNEHRLLTRLICAGEETSKLTNNIETPPTTPDSFKTNLTSSINNSVNTKSQVISNETKIVTANNVKQTRDMAAIPPKFYTNEVFDKKDATYSCPKEQSNYDAETLFYLEGMEDTPTSVQLQSSDEETDTDSGQDEGIHMPRGQRTGHPTMAKSLPVNVPVFPSLVRRRVQDQDDDQLSRDPLDPHNIRASIKALAKSVHGDTVFGDLPRPRFSTQI